MLTLRRPTDAAIREFLQTRREAPYSYSHVGATLDERAAPGCNVDRHRVLLGRGNDAFARAVAALRGWKMFPPQIVQLCWPETPIEPGEVVAGLYRGPRVWAVLPCRVVYTIDEPIADTRRFGFGYGTLEGHMEAGEERFLVEQVPSGEVYYDLFVLSRPASRLARIGYVFTRREQARFRRLSGEAMQRCAAIGLRDSL
jgi:uncharacterized protein (UPF0548 family)